MSNRNGQVFGLTVLSPVRPGRVDGIRHPAAIRETLAALPPNAFASVATTHMARWVVLDDVPFEGVPAHEDHLASAYLLFTSDFDGELDEYLAQLATAMSETFALVYQHCLGFPGTSDIEAFALFMKECMVDTTFLFAAYPNATVEDVVRAVASQRALVAFVDAHQQSGPTELQAAFLGFLETLEQTPLPAPGAM